MINKDGKCSNTAVDSVENDGKWRIAGTFFATASGRRHGGFISYTVKEHVLGAAIRNRQEREEHSSRFSKKILD